MFGASTEWAALQARFLLPSLLQTAIYCQVAGVVNVAIYAFLLTTAILKTSMHFTTITTTKEEQEEGLDFTFFGEKNK